MVVGCQPYAPTAFTSSKYSWYSFLLEAESTPGPQCDWKDFMTLKNPVTPAGTEPATRFLAQHNLYHVTLLIYILQAVLHKLVRPVLKHYTVV